MNGRRTALRAGLVLGRQLALLGFHKGVMTLVDESVQRRVLAGVLAAVRGPSTWSADDAPAGIEQRVKALVAEHVPDSDEGHRTAMRRDLSRRLLDDPVINYATRTFGGQPRRVSGDQAGL